jgi:hypothetical protein
MKYLVVAKSNQIQIPPERAVGLYKATLAWIDERVKDGRIDVNYTFIGGGGLAIANVNTLEQAFAELLSYPLYAFFEWEVKPLVDYRQAFDIIIEGYTKMGAK